MKNETDETQVAVENVKELVTTFTSPRHLSAMIRKGAMNLSIYALQDVDKPSDTHEVVYWLSELAERIYPVNEDKQTFDLHKD